MSRATLTSIRGGGRVPSKSRVPGNVFALGTVSLITDISSEMITAILPVYLMFGLGLSALGLGFVDGVYSGSAVLVGLVGGQIADRTQRHKAVAGAGYGLSAACKLGLLAAGASIGWITSVIGLDRVGKGLRTAPRDAMISLSSPPEILGRSFGVHRAMDTAGAVIGPLVAFAVLRAVPGQYDPVFVVSFCFAAAGVVVLMAFVRDRRGPAPDRHDVSLRAAARLLRQPAYRRIAIMSTVLALVTLSDAFVYLMLQRELDVAIEFFPLFSVGTSVVFLVAAVPAGRLADRIGRWRVFLGGNACMVAVYLLLLSDLRGWWLLILTLTMHGLYYAATNGVLMAAAAPELTSALRTSGLALVQTGTAVAAFGSSVLFGWLWTVAGPTQALHVMLIALTVALIPLAVAAVPSPRSRPGAPAL